MRCSDHLDSDCAIERAVFLSTSRQLFDLHVKHALEYFYGVPAFVSNFVAGKTGLPFHAVIDHTILRAAIANQMVEFETQRQ
jgi:hypothetical protein